jgi:hypothetical protein
MKFTRLAIALYLFGIYTIRLYSIEYAYPVGWCTQQGCLRILMVYQMKNRKTQLWWWDPISKRAMQALPSYYNPGGIAMLPSGNGYSFIHNDILYVKEHNKRSPKTIEFDEPLHSLQIIEWITDKQYIFAASRGTKRCIYQADISGTCSCIVECVPSCDYLYPQLQHATLFCIVRNDGKKFSIEQAPYRSLDDSFEKKRDSAIKTRLVIDFAEQSIAFLHMINDHEGFVLAHPPLQTMNEDYSYCSYYHIYADKKTWCKDKLFDMKIPLTLISSTSQECLYESILPLLPKYDEKTRSIYYSDLYISAGVTEHVLCRYHCDTHTNDLIAHFGDRYIFGTVLCNTTVYVGGQLSPDQVRMFFNEQGETCFTLYSTTNLSR